MAGSRTLKLSILADVDDLRQKLNTADNDVQGFAGKIEKFGKAAAVAFAAAAAAAGAYAVDGVKAAIEDEAAQKRLQTALESTTGATQDQVKAIEAQILKTSLATGVADDQLRPALQRLALATRDTQKAQELLTLALDISAATGKPLEAVTNALGKAYEGNTGALAKLGVGIGAAELKSMGLAKATDELQKLFAGAASAQANTYEGKIARLRVAFDETKESIGAALLPVLEKLLSFINKIAQPIIDALNNSLDNKQGLASYFNYLSKTIETIFVPTWNGLKSAFNSIKSAIGDNLDAFKEFGSYIATYLAPVIGTVLGGALTIVGKIAGGVIDVIGGIIRVINTLIGNAIDSINALIKAYNAVPLLPNVPTISKPSVSVSVPETPSLKLPSTTIPTVPTSTTTSGGSSSTVSKAAATTAAASSAFNSVNIAAAQSINPNNPFRGEVQNVTVNIGVAGDPEATARTIVDVLNQSSYRGTGGAGAFQLA